MGDLFPREPGDSIAEQIARAIRRAWDVVDGRDDGDVREELSELLSWFVKDWKAAALSLRTGVGAHEAVHWVFDCDLGSDEVIARLLDSDVLANLCQSLCAVCQANLANEKTPAPYREFCAEFKEYLQGGTGAREDRSMWSVFLAELCRGDE